LNEGIIFMANTIEREFVALVSATSSRNGAGFNPCQGLYYRPPGKRPTVAAIATHYNVDFSEHFLGEYLAARGIGFLGWNTRFRGAEAFFLLEHALIDIGAGVAWLREVAGVEYVVLIGNSGGGSLMAAYQSQAVEPNIKPGFGLRLPEAVLRLPAGDAYVSLNAHGGRPEVLTAWMDPAVTDESDPFSIEPDLNMYGAENRPPYAPQFVERYRVAQVARNERITEWCLAQLESMRSRGYVDRAFNVYRTWADLRLMDGTLDPSARPVGVCYRGDPKAANFSPGGIGLTNTCRSWLSMWSLRNSDCRGTAHLARITVPTLVIQSLADTGVFPCDARTIHDTVGSLDKELQFISGDHYLTSPAHSRTEVSDRISAWLLRVAGYCT